METLDAVLDTLLPGDGVFPPASATGLGARLAVHDRFSASLTHALSRLPPAFADLPTDERIEVLRGLEARHATAFGALLTGAYSLYYTHPLVAAAIERATGHAARPPQPGGYDLKPFDPALIAVAAARPPQYRPTPEGSHDRT